MLKFILKTIFIYFLFLSSYGLAKVSKEQSEYVKNLVRAGEKYWCNPRGFFTGYARPTQFAFSGNKIVIFSEKIDRDKKQWTIKEVFHIADIRDRKQFTIIAESTPPSFLSDNYFGSLIIQWEDIINSGFQLNYIRSNGKSKSTKFWCAGHLADEQF